MKNTSVDAEKVDDCGRRCRG